MDIKKNTKIDKREALNNADKVKLLKKLLDTRIDNKIEISLYTKNDKEFKTLLNICRKYDLHEYSISRDNIYWVYFHNGYDKASVVSTNIQICIFEPKDK